MLPRVEELRAPAHITTENAIDVMQTARAARSIGENVREQILSSPALPRGVNRPVAVLAENLAVAAWKLETARLDEANSPYWREMPLLAERYNESLIAFFDAMELVEGQKWDTIRARYGAVSRDSAPGILKGCLGVLPALVLRR